jgi:bacterioferritin (cytochrome b1)
MTRRKIFSAGGSIMDTVKQELVNSLNRALALEQAARIQYLAHAEEIKGKDAEPIISRLREIAEDEEKHEKHFREMIGDYLGGVPAMGVATEMFRKAKTLMEILDANLENEKQSIDVYKDTYQKLIANKQALPYEFEHLEHSLRHVILDEQEHITELNRLKGL